MKKTWQVFIVVLAAFVVLSSATLAQSTGSATTITDLMGERPSNAYYQNSGLQAQGSSSSTDSASASILQQETTSELKVVAPAATTTTVTVPKSSSNWKLFVILAVVFLVAAAALFVWGILSKQPVAVAAPKTIKVKGPPVKKTTKKPKAKKSAKKK